MKLDKKTILEIFLKWAKRRNKNNDTVFKIRTTNKILLIERMEKLKTFKKL